MGCCDPINDLSERQLEMHEECEDCGAKVDDEGNTLEGCEYSPIVCKTCGYCPCDLSC